MSINRKASFGIIYPVINPPGNGFPGASVGPLAGKKQDSHAILYNGLNWLNGCLGFDVGAGIVPISAKLFFAEKAEKMNIEHRTPNIERRILMALRFVYFKSSEPQNVERQLFRFPQPFL